MKRCSKCDENKPMSEFSKHKGKKDGLQSQCKKCVSAYHRKYRVANVDRMNATSAKWRANNQERIKAYIAANQDKYKVAQIKWRSNNRDTMAARCAEWRRKNPGLRRAISSRWRARKRNAKGDATAEQRQARWEVYGGRCYICNAVAEAIDHVIPLAAGGTNWPANLRPICKHCNSVKHACWPYDFVAARMAILNPQSA